MKPIWKTVIKALVLVCKLVTWISNSKNKGNKQAEEANADQPPREDEIKG